tara:strand:+ start:1318 stop:1953 length:636 start_codon:yes stop_codon:yes gene_type:complete
MEESHYLRDLMQKTLLEYLKKTNIKPQSLLFFRIFFALLTGVVLFMGEYVLSLIFLTIYQFVFLLDYVDGPLARFRNEFSPKLNKVDRLAHSLTTFLFLLAITTSYYFSSSNIFLLGVGLVGSFSVLSNLLLEVFWTNNRGISLKELKKLHKVKKRNFLFYNFFRIDGPFTLFFFLVIFNFLVITIWLFGIMQFLIFLKKIYTLIKWIKKR